MRDLTHDERDVLYKLANWAEEHPGKWAMLNYDHEKPLRILLRRGWCIKATFDNGRKGAMITQSGYDESNRLWDTDTHNNPEAVKA